MKRYITKIVIVCMFLVFVFSACSNKVNETYEYLIAYIDKSETQLIYEKYNAESVSDYELIGELINKMKTVPESKDAIVPGFDVTDIKSYELTSEGNLILNFDAGYNTLTHVKEILCRAAIVKTLCQIEGVNGVEFYVNEAPLTDNSGNLYGYMSEETFVDNTSGETTYKQTLGANLYFSDASGKKLVKVPISVTFDGTISLEQLIMDQLIKGPESINSVDKSLLATIPSKTVVNQITVREQICYIDLNKDFITSVDNIDKEVTLYSVVNSLVELHDINKVQFSIDGETMKFFGNSDIRFDTPLERNLEIIKN